MAYKWDISTIPTNAVIDNVSVTLGAETSTDGNSSDIAFRIRALTLTQFNAPASESNYSALTSGAQFNRAVVTTTLSWQWGQPITLGTGGVNAIATARLGGVNDFELSVVADTDDSWGTGFGSYDRVRFYGTAGGLDALGGAKLNVSYHVPTWQITATNSFGTGYFNAAPPSNFPQYSSGTPVPFVNRTQVTLEASSQDAGGHHFWFQNWQFPQGNIVTTNTNYSFVATASASYYAYFLEQFYMGVTPATYVEAGSGESYIVNNSNVGSTYNWLQTQNTAVTLQCAPPPGYIVVNWNDGTSLNPRTITPTDNTLGIHTLLKFHTGSSNASATGSNNQRKIGKDYARGYYHLVYESAGDIWYTSSADGVIWAPEQLVSDGTGTNFNPLMDLPTTPDFQFLSIVWVNTNTKRVMYRQASWNYDGSGFQWASIEMISGGVPVPYNPAAYTPVVSNWYVACNFYYNNGAAGAVQLWYRYAGAWRSAGSAPLSNAYSNHPGIVGGSSADCHLVFQDDAYHTIRYNHVTTSDYTTFAWGTTESVPPSDWESNQVPSITLLEGYWNGYPVVAWQSHNNIVEGGTSVHCRMRSYNGWTTSIQSFSYSQNINLFPSIGTVSGSDKVALSWSENGNITTASCGTGGWTGPTIVASGSQGGTYPTVARSATVQKMIWKTSSLALSVSGSGVNPSIAPGPNAGSGGSVGPLQKSVADGSSQPAGTPLAYRWVRHGLIQLEDVFNDLGSNAPSGTIAFEIASIKKVTASGTTPLQVATSWDTTTRATWFSSLPFTVGAGATTLNIAGAVYGMNLKLPPAGLLLTKEPLATVALIDMSTGRTVSTLWSIPYTDLASSNDNAFGAYRNLQVNLQPFAGMTLALRIDMLGKSKNIVPVIVDDYIISSSQSTISSSQQGHNEEQGKQEETAPTKFALYHCYPNPFNPTTTISYDVPEPTHVTIKLYNMLGEQVQTLVSGWIESGQHTVVANLSGMPSGVYVYRLTAGTFTESKRMVLVK